MSIKTILTNWFKLATYTMVAKSDVQLKLNLIQFVKNFSFSFSTGSEINHSWIKHCWKWSNSWIHTLFAEPLHFAKWVYHTKKLKKSWALSLDRQLKQLISVFWERTLTWRKNLQDSQKTQRRAKTDSSKSGKRPKNNIRTNKSSVKLFFNVKNSF